MHARTKRTRALMRRFRLRCLFRALLLCTPLSAGTITMGSHEYLRQHGSVAAMPSDNQYTHNMQQANNSTQIHIHIHIHIFTRDCSSCDGAELWLNIQYRFVSLLAGHMLALPFMSAMCHHTSLSLSLPDGAGQLTVLVMLHVNARNTLP